MNSRQRRVFRRAIDRNEVLAPRLRRVSYELGNPRPIWNPKPVLISEILR